MFDLNPDKANLLDKVSETKIAVVNDTKWHH